MNLYEKLIQIGGSKACDRNEKPQLLKERHLHVLWAEKNWKGVFKSHSGDEIEVLSPGIWNLGPGPDFLKGKSK